MLRLRVADGGWRSGVRRLWLAAVSRVSKGAVRRAMKPVRPHGGLPAPLWRALHAKQHTDPDYRRVGRARELPLEPSFVERLRARMITVGPEQQKALLDRFYGR